MDGPVARARASLRAIEALERLTASGALPSGTDLDELRGWAGWGPMAPAFAPGRSGAWKEIGERLEWLLPPDHLREAEQATPNAFYTPPALAGACWQILRGLGFTGGKVLEPGCGAGVFIAATPPDVTAEWKGVERDPTTARIAALLHPQAELVNERLQNAALPAHSVDAVIGNVPFSEAAVYDPTAPKAVTKSLHNYCIWRSLRTLRPGGVAVLITSRFTLDSRERAARLAIADEADLVGGIRLPGEALSPGGTDVVADILMLRRRQGENACNDDSWLDSVLLAEAFPDWQWAWDDRVNQWFVTHRDMVLGELRPNLGARFGHSLRVERRAEAVPAELAVAAAADQVVASARRHGLTWAVQAGVAPLAGDVGVVQRADGRKEQSFHLIDGAVFQVQDGELVPIGKRGKELAELTSLIRLRDAAIDLLDAETDHGRGEDSLAPLRARLNNSYDRYVAAYGPLNRATITSGEPDPETGIATVSRRRPRMGGFRQDPDYVTVLALEDYNDETGHAAKTAIFSQRVNQPPTRPTSVSTAAEAIRVCLDARGRLDIAVIGELLGIPASEVPARLDELAYRDPVGGDWVTAEEYLSGDVRAKLAAAHAAAGEWPANIAALEKVQPADLGPDEIRAKLGAPWIPAEDVRAFAAELLGYPATVTYMPVTAQWEIKIDGGLADTAAATEEWGTSRIHGYHLIELACNGKAPVVYDTIQTPDGEKRVRNQAETLLAEDKQRAIAARFGEWAWEDPQRTDRLATGYNRRFNSVVLRRYDGSHLTFPGLAAGFTPYPHQADMVHRIISSQATLCPYPVGTGKTPVMFLAARKLKELGLAAKPLIIVPNHLLEQTAREGKRLFPSARILMAAREDLADARTRKLFAARCATGDWDAVVMTHSAFTAMPVHPRTQAAHLTDLAARYRQALAESPGGGNRTVKQIAKMVDAFETRARTLLDHRTDDGVWFEHLGADFMMVDESHYFKNLGVPVRTDGFSIAASKRATDLDMKLTLLRGNGGKVAALFTGTPVSNSLLEMYVLQHYLHPQRLDEIGLASADAWAATFVEFQTTVEVTPDGASFRLKRRPTKFENVPELLTLFGEVADLRPPESFAVERPGGRHHNVVIRPSPELREYVAKLAERADKVRQVDARTDNMLKICSDGRKAALDLGLVGIASSRPGKVGAVVANVARIYHESRQLDLAGAVGGFQIVFCDLGTPNADSSQVYGEIRSGLIAAGVPAAGIRFIHDAETDLAKAALFTDCRAGKIAVLLGSTDKLGVGTNIQTRCVALHHVDAPWRPADVEQREGRALRPGNLNPSVDLFRYVTEKSFDSFMWQTLERKARFIGQVLSGRPVGRDVDDIGDPTLSYAEVKALATGNPLLLELAEVNAEVTRLRQLSTAHTRGTRRLTDSIGGWRQQISAKNKLADDCDLIVRTAARQSEQSWCDQRGRVIPEDDVAGYLARQAVNAMAATGTYAAVSWRGLRIGFDAERRWRDIKPFATIRAGGASLAVELSPAWTGKGQQWRIEKAIESAVAGADRTSGRLRAEVEDLTKRIADASRRVGEPFPHVAELEAARTRRDAIEQAIRDTATPQGNDGERNPELSDEPADLDGVESAEIYAIHALDAMDDTGRIILSSIQAWSEATSPVAKPEPGALVQPVKHPAVVAQLDGTAEPLFTLPNPPRDTRTAASGHVVGRPRRPSGPTASGEPIQAALFDLPAPGPAPARAAGQAKHQARRR